MNLVIALIGLGLLIFVHEGGHFLTALAVGMRPRSFNIGFGPPLAKTTRGGIVYAVRAIPLGGYVKIPGMHRPSPGDVDAQLVAALREAPELTSPAERLKRALKVTDIDIEAARAAHAELAAAIAAAEVGPEARRSADRGLTEIGDGLSDDAYWRARTWKRVAAIVAGPAANVVCAIALFAIYFMAGGGEPTRTVESVLKGTPAAKVGLRGGDAILAIDRRPVTPREIPERIQGSNGRPITLTVDRRERRLSLGPVRAVKDQGAYRLGFRLKGTGLAFGPALWRSVKLTGIVSREIALSLGRLFHHEGRKEITSTVGIVDQSANSLRQGIAPYLGVLGLISLSLGLFNLLPLLPLDGGHIAFSLIEGIRRRAVPREVYERLSAVGIALVLLLFFVGLSNDIGRIGG